jgi:hypothetical protein
MAGSKAEGTCGNWIGIQNGCWSVGTMVGVMMTITMLSASRMCGRLLWLWRDSVVGCALESFSSWIQRRWNNPLSNDLCIPRGTCNIEVYLSFSPYHGLGLNSHLWVMIVSLGVICSVLAFWPWRSEIFLPVF